QVIDATLARAMCESVCMVLVFSPKYFDRFYPYCAREYRGMLDIEARRLRALSPDKRGHGCIIPVVFRGALDDLPPEIRQRKYYDLSDYTLASTNALGQDSYIRIFDEIGQRVRMLYEAFSELEEPVCGECDAFTLPEEQVVVEWLKTFPQRRSLFP